MEPRKIIKLGNSSYAIALPKDWVDKSGLRKGDTVSILPNSNGELILTSTPLERNGNKTKKLDFSNSDMEMIKTELKSAYVQDNDILEITGANKEKIDVIKKITQQMIGFEIIDARDNKLVIKDFFNIHEVNLGNFLRKIDNSIRSMLDDIILFLENPETKNKYSAEMYETDDEINKSYILITRILFKGLDNPSVLSSLKIDSKYLFNHWWIAFNLEHIADEIKRITKLLSQKKQNKKQLNSLYHLCNKIKENYIESLNACHKHDLKQAYLALKKNDSLNSVFDKFLEEKNAHIREMSIKLSYIKRHIHHINKILLYGGPSHETD